MTNQHISILKYRPDIDGLRAIAVLLVIGFHAFPSIISGGFVGVDIFFVISGYLITSIIIKNLNENKFSFINFYASRTRRIFPVLILVLISSSLFGLLILHEDEFNRLIKHIAGGSAFVLNYILTNEGGYFDRLAESKPLLHLWSLAVEEQFYLIWPFIVWIIWLSRKNFYFFILFFLIASFSWNLIEIKLNPIETFYSLLTRFWELLIGAGLAYLVIYKNSTLPKSQFSKNFISILGLSLILSAVFLINSHTLFPGYWALIPTIGSALIIASSSDGLINRYVLSNNKMIWIGLISYPLYLWHWPIFSFARIYFNGQPTIFIQFLLILISVAFASFTYYFFERPIRSQFATNRISLILFSMLSIILGISLYLYIFPLKNDLSTADEKSKFYSYFADIPSKRWLTYFEKEFRHECNFYQIDSYYSSKPTNTPKDEIDKSCYIPDHSKKYRVLIWGDSHAQMLNSGLTKQLPNDWQVMQIASSGCAASIVYSQQSNSDYCTHSNKFALNVIAKTIPNVVIIAQSTGHNIESMNKIYDELKKLNVNTIIFVGASPHWQDDLPKLIVRRFWPNIPERTWEGINIDVYQNNLKIKNQFSQNPNKIFIDMFELFCNINGCLTRLGSDSKKDATTWDYGHLTEIASEYFAKQLLVPQILKSIN